MFSSQAPALKITQEHWHRISMPPDVRYCQTLHPQKTVEECVCRDQHPDCLKGWKQGQEHQSAQKNVPFHICDQLFQQERQQSNQVLEYDRFIQGCSSGLWGHTKKDLRS